MLSCIVIGAGPAGLVCTKELLEQGVDNILCLERSEGIGGTFAGAYDNLRLTSSRLFSMFSDFWVGDEDEDPFWKKAEAVAYWTRYAEHFGVFEHIRFGAAVSRVSRGGGGGWELQLTGGETLHSERIVLAVGNNSHPRSPAWRELLTEVEHSHSHDYKNAEPFVGKRVLAVGGGESGSDVALEISQVAEKCWVSLRESTGWLVPRLRNGRVADISTHRGLWGVPRKYGTQHSQNIIRLERAYGDPVHDVVADLDSRVRAKIGIWGTYGTKTFSLPKAVAHHGAEVVGEIVAVRDGGRTLETADGAVLDHLDAVVFSTGYHNRVAFLPEGLRECDPRSLYKHMLHPGYGDRIAWIGWARPGFGSQFPIMEMQARLFALVCAGKHTLPSAAGMEEVASRDRAANLEQFQHNARNIRSLVDYHRYMDDLAAVIGCEPPVFKYFLRHPRLWLRIMYGPTQATQYRLQGPGKKVELAHEILSKIPVSTFNHVVKAGLKLRLRHGLESMIPSFGRAAG